VSLHSLAVQDRKRVAQTGGSLYPQDRNDIGILLPNNQRQHRPEGRAVIHIVLITVPRVRIGNGWRRLGDPSPAASGEAAAESAGAPA